MKRVLIVLLIAALTAAALWVLTELEGSVTGPTPGKTSTSTFVPGGHSATHFGRPFSLYTLSVWPFDNRHQIAYLQAETERA